MAARLSLFSSSFNRFILALSPAHTVILFWGAQSYRTVRRRLAASIDPCVASYSSPLFCSNYSLPPLPKKTTISTPTGPADRKLRGRRQLFSTPVTPLHCLTLRFSRPALLYLLLYSTVPAVQCRTTVCPCTLLYMYNTLDSTYRLNAQYRPE